MNLSDMENEDLFNLMCGKVLGRGAYRTVYSCPIREDWVVKLDTCENFSNICEYQIYRELQDTPIGKWLAPVRWVSAKGMWLIQDKTEPIQRKQMPKKIPSLFADIKLDNWGMLKGRPVCHDYGNNYVYELAGKHGRKLKKAPSFS